ncbi:MAG: hypothetical protein RLZZ440_291 [Planctomycetota bacterium]
MILPAPLSNPCTMLWAWPLAIGAGLAVGAAVSQGVRPLLDPLPGDAGRHRGLILLTAIAATVLWWWEAHRQAMLPSDSPAPGCGVTALRFAGHLLLGGFLAAAAWTDLRHRVIPDAITVPGVLAGLAWNTLFPWTLPPITRELARSFAPPTIESDVLGAFGGLAAAGVPAALGPPPAWLGLVTATFLFALWWWIGLPPDAPRDAADGRGRPQIRWLVLIGGSGWILATWLIGGPHWTGLVTALVGLAGAAGMIWATRIGASLALGREAMGFGDVTLMAMVGSWLGWQPCVLVCMLGVFIGLAHGVSQLLRHAESELPFGPSLCLGAVAVVTGWRSLWAAAGPQFARPLELATVVALVIGLTAVTLWGWQRLRGSPPG